MRRLNDGLLEALEAMPVGDLLPWKSENMRSLRSRVHIWGKGRNRRFECHVDRVTRVLNIRRVD